MMQKRKKIFFNALITAVILVSCFAISVLLQNLLDIQDHINTVFVFGVFLVSLMTCGLTTRLKKWQELKAEGEREMMRANLLRAVSHDLRTPLTTIYGSASAIIDNPDTLTEEQKRKLISGIQDDSEWLIRMVENLLSVTRLDSSKVELLKSPIVVDELIDSVISKFKKRYPNQPLEVSIPDDILIVPMDALLIEQVIFNILENAIHHAVGMTRLSLKIESCCGNAVFEISDNGCGIEPERLDVIFSGRYDSPKSADNGRRNSGIGLSVCATIIKAHGGYIEAENNKDGGALLRFALKSEVNNYYDE